MPRFDYGTVGAYFITICAREKKKVFGRVVGGGVLDAPRVSPSPHGEIVIAQLEAMTNFYPDLQIEKYVVMPNRIHFMVVVTQCPSGASRTPSPTTHGRQPWQVLRFPLAPCLSILSDTKIGPAHLGEPVRFLCAPGERTFYRVKVPSPPGSGKG